MVISDRWSIDGEAYSRHFDGLAHKDFIANAFQSFKAYDRVVFVEFPYWEAISSVYEELIVAMKEDEEAKAKFGGHFILPIDQTVEQ